MKRLLVVIAATLLVASCSSTSQDSSATTDPRPSIVVTYSVLGALVDELVGDAALVTVVIPDGQDPHDFEPSAKDIE
ncbi:MAG: zinc ABC transporter substrate-binding protein AdcA, partial [Actinobacteria bacterium]|nr:zinc ABC transporter substrate-binding protein AdcA [Actinomycetota bacterium]